MKRAIQMKWMAVIVLSLSAIAASAASPWSTERFASFLRGDCRFIESDYDEDDDVDIPARMRNALPLFHDVFEKTGWTTNELINALIAVVSNGLVSANLQNPDKRRAAVVAMRQLSDINHPAVTNYFNSIVTEDLHTMEKIAIPGLFKYTNLEPGVMARLYELCVMTNRYEKAAAMVTADLLECLKTIPAPERELAKTRVAKYFYFSMRHTPSEQFWPDEELAEMIPSYSNSIQRLEQMRYLLQYSTNSYVREDATIQLNRLSAMPSNELNNVSWISDFGNH